MNRTERFTFLCYFIYIFLLGITESNSNILRNSPKIITAPSPPDHKQYVAMARYVVHQADWTSLATISSIPKIQGFPFTNIISMSDGPVDKSLGIPYFYLTPLDFASIDLKKDNRCTISVTLEETGYCQQQKLDPEDPRCARVMLSGRIIELPNGTDEYNFAKNALFTRHPSMKTLPADHKFYVAKLVLEHIVMLDWFGGPITIDIDEYLAYNFNKIYNSKLSLFNNIEINTI